MKNKNLARNIFAVLSILFYLLIFLAPVIETPIIKAHSYTPRFKFTMPLVVLMVCAGAFIIATVVRKKIMVVVAVLLSVVSSLCILVGNIIEKMSEDSYIPGIGFEDCILIGAPFLLLLLAVKYMMTKAKNRKALMIAQIIIVILLVWVFGRNVYVASGRANAFIYGFWGVNWENIYLEPVMVINSIANVFWAVWLVLCDVKLDRDGDKQQPGSK